jgi:hypothetical protein
MRRESQGDTLQTSTLINEAYFAVKSLVEPNHHQG